MAFTAINSTKRPMPSSSFVSSRFSKRLKRLDTMSITYTSPKLPESTTSGSVSSAKKKTTLPPYVYEPPPLPPLPVTETSASHPLATATDIPSSSPITTSPAELAWARSSTPETPCPVLSSPSHGTPSREATPPSLQPPLPLPPLRRQPSHLFSQATTPPILPPTSTSFFDPVTNQYYLPPPVPVIMSYHPPLPEDTARHLAIIRLEGSIMNVKLPSLVTQEGTYEGNVKQAWLSMWDGGRSWRETTGMEKEQKLTCVEVCCEECGWRRY